RAGMDDAGAVEEDVDAADLAREGLDARRVGDVEHVPLAALERPEGGRVHVGRDHARPFARKGLRRRAPDALSRRGDEGGLPGESHGEIVIDIRMGLTTESTEGPWEYEVGAGRPLWRPPCSLWFDGRSGTGTTVGGTRPARLEFPA